MPFLTRYKGPSQWLSRTAERLPMCPRTREGGIRVRLRMFRRSTHAAFRARSFFCDHSHHWRGDYLARRTADTASSQSRAVSGPPYAALRSAKSARSRPPAAAFGLRRQLAQSNCCGQRKRQTAQLGSHARESEGGVSLASLADRAWLCAADLLEHTLSRLTAFVDRESAMFWPRARWRCHAIVHRWGDAMD